MLAPDRFDTAPQVKQATNKRPKKKRPELPQNPEKEPTGEKRAVGRGRFPSWLHRKLPKGNKLWETSQVLRDNALSTVCEECKCPNRLECFSKKTATYLVLGHQCTRACGFCDIDFAKAPPPPPADEAERLVVSVEQLGLKHVVITMVTRDDLEDGGAEHLAQILSTLKNQLPEVSIEILTSDFAGNEKAWDIVLESEIDIFNHNIETVQALTPRVRHKATYERSLALLSYAKKQRPAILVKSGIMVGLGETEDQVKTSIHDLKEAGCSIVTIGQYLQPNRHKLPVKSFVTPEQFEVYAAYGRSIGVPHMYCGPFVRSSYNAAQVMDHIRGSN